MGLLNMICLTYSLNFLQVLDSHLLAICSYSCSVSRIPIIRLLDNFFSFITIHFTGLLLKCFKPFIKPQPTSEGSGQIRVFNNRTSGRLLKRGNLKAFRIFFKYFEVIFCILRYLINIVEVYFLDLIITLFLKLLS